MGLTLSAILFAPALAGAQNSGIFIQAGPVLDVRQESTSDFVPSIATLSFGPVAGDLMMPVPSDEQTRTTRERFAPGGSLAVGVFLSPSVSLRVETSFHGKHVSSDETSSTIAGIRTFTQYTNSTTDIAIAAGWHQGSGRTTVTYLGGVVFSRERQETFASATFPSLVIRNVGGRLTQILESETHDETFNTTSYNTGVVAGLDVTVDVSSHFAIVPQLRMVGVSHAWSIRPAVVVRWRP